ncbi:MAG TPA: double-strand break repair helicase AddA, partial [Rhodospirillaceae bacterium]|nr:double-strand break repair helicase AddA [Rhodospirillaceae bacterium]
MARESVRKPQEGNLDERSINAGALQKTASDPANSVWVSASAGTGKTTVLTQRVLRLMLPQQNGTPGTPPHKILCLTYTRAGASEMALRVGAALSRWAVMTLDELRADLTKLLGWPADETTLTAARRLFTQVVDTPGGLKIMTIHSFCQSVLGRFSLEAQVPPHFTLLEGSEQDVLLSRARHIAMAKAAPAGSPLRQALEVVAAQIDEESFLTLLGAMAQERKLLFDLMREWGPDGLYTALCAALGILPGRTPEDIKREACRSDSIAESDLRRTCAVMAASKSEEESRFAYKIQLWLDAAPEARTDRFDDYAEIFIPNSTGKPRARNFPSKATTKTFPESEAILRAESQRLIDVHEDIRKSLCARGTASLLHLGYEIIGEFQNLKKNAGRLDYTDLILCTLDLLQGRTTDIKSENIVDWVMYKLDQGIDHILIDEAQDTNPEQWDIIETLCAEFFSGSGAREDIERTVFAVGDEKQSIFSFQRAAPEEFSRMRTAMAGRVSAAGKTFADIGLNISFRSTESVLNLVDQVFLKSEAAKGLGSGPIEHIAARSRDPGLVELWPLFESEKPEKRDPWEPPTRIIEAKGGAASLAQHIADSIHGWLESKEVLPSTGLPVTPGDIMILVRKRMPFTEPLMRALKNKGIPVSGADRMILNDQISVQDLLAVASFALLPSDDLTLATILKSPLIDMGEDSLLNLAIGRTGTLWAALKRSENNLIANYLAELIDLATYSTPYTFFSHILHSPCPADSQSGWRAMQARLGPDIKDPLDEFLNAVLLYESEHTPSLQGFLHWQSQGHTEIKREMDDGGGQVRIMTVHGAKGLEAPIVILPDTTRTARGGARQPARRLIWPHKSGLPVPLWSPRADADCGMFEIAYDAQQEKEDEEYRRLFYVAL